MSQSEIDLDLGTVTMSCTAPEIATIFAGLLREMRRMIPRLRPDEMEILRSIMRAERGSVTVGDLFPDFTRESEPHLTLRRLRAAQFIRPARTGRWEPEEPIEVKPFARLMWDRVGEEGFFLSRVQTHNPSPSEKSRLPAPPKATWDDDLLDLRDHGGEQYQETP